MLNSLPNILTMSRIAMIPAMVGAFYLDFPLANWVAFGVFAAAGITDFFDGMLARSWNQQSALGRFLDPVADKLLIAAAILMLVAFKHIQGLDVLAAVVVADEDALHDGWPVRWQLVVAVAADPAGGH